MAKDTSFGGASVFDIRLAVIVGVLLLIGLTVSAFLVMDGFKSDQAKTMVNDYHEIIKIAAGGGLITLGIAIGQRMTNNNINTTDNRGSIPDPSKID